MSKGLRDLVLAGFSDPYLQLDEKSFFSISYMIPKMKEIITRWGTLTFTDRVPSFGDEIFMPVRTHGDLGCSCEHCAICNIVSKERKNGWFCKNKK